MPSTGMNALLTHCGPYDARKIWVSIGSGDSFLPNNYMVDRFITWTFIMTWNFCSFMNPYLLNAALLHDLSIY